jgi:hypothetical protein
MKTKLVTFLALLTGIWFIQDILRGKSTAIAGGWQNNLPLLIFMGLGLLGMILSLRWQGLGGLIALSTSIAITVLVYVSSRTNPLGNALFLGSVYFIAGALGLIAWQRKRKSKKMSTPMALEILHMLLRKEGKTERQIEEIQKQQFGVSLRELVNAGDYKPMLEMEFGEGEKENLIDLMDNPSDRYRSFTHDEARMFHIPETIKAKAIQSLKAVKTQPHLPYSKFKEFVSATSKSKKNPSSLKTRLRDMLSQERDGAFASVCLDCETVIGLHNAPSGIDAPQFSAILTIVGAENGWTCPVCGSSQWAFMKSGALNTGYSLDRLIPLDLRQPGNWGG